MKPTSPVLLFSAALLAVPLLSDAAETASADGGKPTQRELLQPPKMRIASPISAGSH